MHTPSATVITYLVYGYAVLKAFTFTGRKRMKWIEKKTRTSLMLQQNWLTIYDCNMKVLDIVKLLER